MFSNLTAHVAVFLVRKALELTQLLAHNLCNNIPTMAGSCSSQRSAAAKAQRNRAFASSGVSPTRQLFILRRKSATSGLMAGWDVWEKTHSRHSRPRGSARDVTSPRAQIRVSLFSPLIISDLFYFCPLVFHHPSGSKHAGQRITHFKPHCAIYKAGLMDKNHLSARTCKQSAVGQLVHSYSTCKPPLDDEKGANQNLKKEPTKAMMDFFFSTYLQR